ncbi:hypothetical protein [Dietzia sp. 179-F 9C3 NHS]|uniref:hypothetical protein n=1 Tax=Dietzia sp. 179-F 9C3 NHS TaxID=3374295 RepID=UPI00387A4025
MTTPTAARQYPDTYADARRLLAEPLTERQDRHVLLDATNTREPDGCTAHLEVRSTKAARVTIEVRSGLPRLRVVGDGVVNVVANSSWGNSVTVADDATVIAQLGDGVKFTGYVEDHGFLVLAGDLGARTNVFADETGHWADVR